MAAGAMVQLAASAVPGELDTTKQLAMFGAYQHVCIANDTNLKIADFANVKLTHAKLTVPHAPGTIIVQGSAPNQAKMKVISTNKDKTNTYGLASYTGTVSGFVAGSATASGIGAGDSPFTLTGPGIDPPHWYDWTSLPAGVLDGLPRSYGSLPERASIGCLYLGRAVLAGNQDEPFQWYMSRQGNIFDWSYSRNDDQSAVAGSEGDVGGPGDIITALAPYKDDYLIIGCATSMYVIFGDPMTGGQMRELDLTTGIFGNTSYCWDAQNNFYWWGTNGLYRTAIPGVPTNISQIRLPDLINDENANATTHRISMAFDNERNGVIITVTTLSSGENSNYWYPIAATGEDGVAGFFPEEYPTQDGAYSLLYYDATTVANRGLLVGCRDGYIRTFDASKLNDNIGATSAAIESYVTFGPIALSPNRNAEGTLSGLDFTMGESSDSVLFKVFTDRTAGGVIEKLEAGTEPRASGTVTPGQRRGTTIRQKVLGAYAGIRIENVNAGETWAFESLTAQPAPSGRIK